jgi:hypothetical protein
MPGRLSGQAPTPSDSMASAGLPFVAGWRGVHLPLRAISVIAGGEKERKMIIAGVCMRLG